MYYTFDKPKDIKDLHTPAVYKVNMNSLNQIVFFCSYVMVSVFG